MTTTKSKKATVKKTNDHNGQSHSQLEKFFTDQVKDIYWAEKHLTKALPKLKKAATTQELKEAIEGHLSQTEEHVTRLEEVFGLLGQKPQAKKCDGMEGLIREGENTVEETEDGTMTRDAAIIMSAQKVEHYEICAYGTLVKLAKTMGNEEIADILATTLDEEKITDRNLSALADKCVNREAMQEMEA